MTQVDSTPRDASSPKLFLFGSQCLTFDAAAFRKLCGQLNSGRDQWAVDALLGLADEWPAVVDSVPKLQYANGEHMLRELAEALRAGELPATLSVLPNILLTPLVVITQLIQYEGFARAASPLAGDMEELSNDMMSNTAALGLCTGTLSTFAAAFSSTSAQLRQHGATAVRLGVLAGALVDAEEGSPGSDGPAASLSVSWNASQSLEDVKGVLRQFPESYIAVFVDERRVTVTSARRLIPTIVERLKAEGIHATTMGLEGRFHCQKHQNDVEELLELCEKMPEFQFPTTSKMLLPVKSESTETYQPTRPAHETALRAILLEPARWCTVFGAVYDSCLTSDDAQVICFGLERCVPPTIARKLGKRLIHISEIDSDHSNLPASLSGPNPTTPHAAFPGDGIAIIGMACDVPGGEDVEGFWDVLTSGQSQHVVVPPERFPMHTPWRETEPHRAWYGNFIKDPDTFDHKFFRKSPREMSSTDPQHRLILKLAYQALEQSGYFTIQEGDRKNHVGCYIGIGNVEYDRNVACYPANAYSATGNLRAFVSGKVSHYFGWTGPSLSIDTACSSSSVAIHQACRAIVSGECSMALAGGVNVMSHPDWFHNLAGASFLSPTGQCKPFDAKGDGYCRGEGAGVVLLKQLASAVADGDQVLGVIASSRVYQNQNCTAITVPNAASLSELFADVVYQARLKPHDITVVEAHGTGTPVGDPAEYDGIRRVLGGPTRTQPLQLSSVKGAIGHSEFASGAVSLIKILLMILEGQVPPQASFTSPSPGLGAVPEDNIQIPTTLKPWDAGFRAALINNYGASGSNASMIVTQAPKTCGPAQLPAACLSASYPFWLTGCDEASLVRYAGKLKRFLQRNRGSTKDLSMRNLAFQIYRQSNRSLSKALIFTASSAQDLAQKLGAFEKGDMKTSSPSQPANRPVVLCFGGQVSMFVGLAKDVFDSSAVFRGHLDHCDAVCQGLGIPSMYPGIFQSFPVEDTVRLQTMLFAMQYASARTWMDCGVNVSAVVGHSFGELTALCVAGALSLQNAVRMIAGRARLIQDKWGDEKGAMLAVEASLADVDALIARSKEASAGTSVLSIACYNGPTSFTLAGRGQDVDAVQEMVHEDARFSKMKTKRLSVTNAFHCALVDPFMDDLEALGRGIRFNAPRIRVEQATEHPGTGRLGADFVARHLRSPVFFSQAVQRLAEDFAGAIWLEAGSNSTVTAMANRALGSGSAHFQAVRLNSGESCLQPLVDATVKLWKEGSRTTFWAHHPKQVAEYTPVLLPPYQFEKSRHWLDLKMPPKVDLEVQGPQTQRVDIPVTLATFLGYTDKSSSCARFRVNTEIEKFQRPLQANFVANTAAVAPGMLQLEVVLDALLHIRPEFKSSGYQPELCGMAHQKPLLALPSTTVYLDATPGGEDGLIWTWKLSGTDTAGTTTDYTTGMVQFHPPNDPTLDGRYRRLARLSQRSRCRALLEDRNAKEILQGRNIYRAFKDIVNYGDTFRCVTKVVAEEHETAGCVTRSFAGDGWIDPILTECFATVAGIHVNLMTDDGDPAGGTVFVCDNIERWLRNPQRADQHATDAASWDVLALHHQESETKYVSDVFAFDAQSGVLAEAILGISYQKVSVESLRRALTPYTHSAPRPSPGATPVPGHAQAPGAPSITPPQQMDGKAKTKEPRKKRTASPGPEVAAKAREIICNLSGLEPDEVADKSDLVEIGIDSLMAMELAKEVDIAFGRTLQTEQLMGLTDFASLVSCIRSILGHPSGFDGQEASEAEDEEPQIRTGGAAPVTKGTNGTHGPQTVQDAQPEAGVNGAHRHPASPSGGPVLPVALAHETFAEVKWQTDDFILQGKLGTYYDEVVPRSNELVFVYLLDAFERLGCNIRTASPGQRLPRVTHLPKHDKYMRLIYGLLETEARLIDIDGDAIKRTAVACPTKSADAVLQALLRDEPVHAAEHKLTALMGPRFAECITGRAEGIHVIFGSAEGRQIVSEMYANSPVTGIWIRQLEHFMHQLVSRLPVDGAPLCILEMGAGTGGTTSRLVPMLARLGVPVRYTMTDLSGSLVAAARKRFKEYPFMEFKVLDIEAPDEKFVQSQHVVLATNCVHATRNLSISLANIHRILKPDGFAMLLEMTEQVPWCDFVFGLVEGWWLFQDDRDYVLVPAEHWERKLHGAGFGHVEWTEGERSEASLQRLIIAHASGPRREATPKPPAPPPASTAAPPPSAGVAERQAAVDAAIAKYAAGFWEPARVARPSDAPAPPGRCVLVTGATGSLGSHVVADLAQRPDVQAVVCLNRLSAAEAGSRQRAALETRGIELGPEAMAKLRVLETDTSRPLLGLAPDVYEELAGTVTDVVHSAWPMSLTRPFRAYETQLRVFRNLLDLVREMAGRRPAPFRPGFQFISSLAVVGNYPAWTGRATVPEQPTTVESVPAAGYADAKLACERLLEATLHAHPARFRAMVVRIAQIAGSTRSGVWNATEYMPFLVRSSQVLRTLPDLDGTLSWTPVDAAAATLGDLLVAPAPAAGLVYHIDNPSRQPWKHVIAALARELAIEPRAVVPYRQWFQRMRRFRASVRDNPALQLVDFFEQYFVPMSCGGLVLETTRTKEHSETLRTLGPIGDHLLARYIASWRRSGFLDPSI